MGSVWAADHSTLRTEVAVKIIAAATPAPAATPAVAAQTLPPYSQEHAQIAVQLICAGASSERALGTARRFPIRTLARPELPPDYTQFHPEGVQRQVVDP